MMEGTPEEEDKMMQALQIELQKRDLRRSIDREPLWTKTILTDSEHKNVQTDTIGTIEETLYDDMSMDRVHNQREIEHNTRADVSFLPDDDGVLRTFVQRYTTMLIKDSAFMEEIPPPLDVHHYAYPNDGENSYSHETRHRHRQHPDLKYLLEEAQLHHGGDGP